MVAFFTSSCEQMANKLIVVLGSGPGLGVATASLFASKGFDVALLSRNGGRLQQDVSTVRKNSGSNVDIKVVAYLVDISDHVALSRRLEQVEADLGPPEVVYFNAARVQPTKIGETSPEYILQDFKVCICTSLSMCPPTFLTLDRP